MSKAKGIATELADILDDYEVGLQEYIKRTNKEVAQDTASDLRSNNPRRTGGYAQGWSAKSTRDGWVTYNKDHYQLTHLLENGHVLVSYGKTRGRVPAKPHIRPVADRRIEEYMEKLRRYKR